MDYIKQNGSSEAEMTGRNYYYLNPDAMLPRPAPRRSKRLVPDTEKDNRYWEKRKRNNEAARRSRENKRRLDVDIRQRVVVVEDEVNLLRKELMVVKTKFGLPLDQRFLSVDQNGELVASNSHANIIPPAFMESQANMSPSATSSTGSDPPRSSSSGSPLDSSGTPLAAVRAPVQTQHQDLVDAMSMPVKKRRRRSLEEELQSQSPPSSLPQMSSSHQEVLPHLPYYSGASYPGQMMWTGSVAAQGQFFSSTQLTAINHQAISGLTQSGQEHANHVTRPEQSQRANLSHISHEPEPRSLPPMESPDNHRLPPINNAFGGPTKEEHQVSQISNIYSDSYSNTHPAGDHTTSPVMALSAPKRIFYDNYDREGLAPADLSVASKNRSVNIHKTALHDLSILESAESLLAMGKREAPPREDDSPDSQDLTSDQEYLEREKIEIRRELQALTAEVVKMKNYVMKDTASGEKETEN